MQCPFCGKDNDQVVDSRSSEGGRVVRRRRKCLSCKRRYTTYERIEDAIRLSVIKKDGSRVPYDRNKIIGGLQAACYKRPVSQEKLLGIVEATEDEIFRNYSREVPSSFIGDTVSRLLRAVDEVAYVRFASVYHAFADLGQLIDEAREIISAPEDHPSQKLLFAEEEKEKQPKK